MKNVSHIKGYFVNSDVKQGKTIIFIWEDGTSESFVFN